MPVRSLMSGWVIASIPEVAGMLSQGLTRTEARANVIDALRLMLSLEPADDDDQREREQFHLTIAALLRHTAAP